MPATSANAIPRRKPAALQLGDTVGIVATASPIKEDLLEAGCKALEKMGYRPFFLPSILESDIYFAGSVERRARELEEMFVRDEVKAILCARGGYGSNHLLAALDLKKIAEHPKIFMGYSDATTLLTWFADAAQMITFHGPMLAKDFARPNGVDVASWQAATSSRPEWRVPCDSATAIVGGVAEGILYGGCLSMLAASLGTPYGIRTEGTILFLEDVNVKPYQLDRMFMQLKLAGKLELVRGIIFGEMLDCASTPEEAPKLQEAIKRLTGNLGIPVAFGLRSGHVSSSNITLPLGVRARLKVDSQVVDSKVALTILEAACVSGNLAASAENRT